MLDHSVVRVDLVRPLPSEDDVKNTLLAFFGPSVYDRCFRFNRYIVLDSKISIACPNSDIARDVGNYYIDSIHRALRDTFAGKSIRISIECDSSVVVPENFVPSSPLPSLGGCGENALEGGGCGRPSPTVVEAETDGMFGSFVAKGNVIFSNFEPKRMGKSPMSFSTFVTDKSNELAFLISQHFAGVLQESTPIDGNLLFISGDVGFGKTHLAKAIQLGSKEAGLKSAYFSAESFTNEFVKSIKDKTTYDLKSYISSNDILIVDDIHSLVGRKVTMLELSRIICNMVDVGKKVVLTSTQKPDLLDLSLKSRVLAGIKVSIGEPSEHLKEQILWQIVGANMVPIGSREVHFLAHNVIGGIRELKGAINRISVASSLNNEQLTIESIRSIIGDLLPDAPSATIVSSSNAGQRVIRAVSCFLNVSSGAILSANRTKKVVYARNLGMYVCRHDLQMPFQEIANLFARNSHNAVIVGIKSVADGLSTGRFCDDLDSIRRVVSRIKLQY